MGYTYCRECGARAEKDNPQCPNCGSSDIGQTYSEMTSEEKKRALAMVDYKKCPKCGKLMRKDDLWCTHCSGRAIEAGLSPILNAIPLPSELPKWMLEKPAKEQFFCRDCYARFNENISNCPECGSAEERKKLSEMSDEEKRWAYKYAKTDYYYAFFLAIFASAAVFGIYLAILFAISKFFNHGTLEAHDYDLAGGISVDIAFALLALAPGMYYKQKEEGFFEKAKGAQKAGFIWFGILAIALTINLIYG